MKKKDVSVIIPTYNRAYSIRNAISSIISQTHPVKEIIVIDDNSSDNTEEVVKSINYNNLIYLRNSVNKGASFSRNIGINHSTSDLIAFLDSDDTWTKDKIKLQLDYMEKYDLDIVSSLMKINQDNGNHTIWPKITSQGDCIIREFYPKTLLINYFGTPSILLKKNIFYKINGFDENLPRWQDWDLIIRLSKIGKIGIINKELVIVNQSKDSITIKKDLLNKAVKHFLQKYDVDISNLEPTFQSKIFAKYSRFFAQAENFKEARKLALKSILKFPFHISPYFSLIISYDKKHLYFRKKEI